MLPRHLFDGAVFLALMLASISALAQGSTLHAPRSTLNAPRSTVLTPAAIFLAIAALSWFWTVDPYLTRNEILRIASAVVLLGLIPWLAAQWPQAIPLTAAAVVAGAALAGLLGFRQWFLNAVFEHTLTWRTFGTFGSPNSLAGHLILVLPISLALLRSAVERWQRWLAGVAVIFIAVAIPLTSSKAAFVALVFSLAFYVVLIVPACPEPGRRGRWRSRLGWAVLLAGGLLVLILAVPGLRERFAAGFTTQNHSWMFRLYVWKGTWRSIADNWLFGTGAGSFRVAYLARASTDFTSAAHQGFLQIAMETGVFGLLAFLAIMAAWARSLVKAGGGRSSLHAPRSTLRAPLQRELAWGAAAGVVASCIHSLFDYDWTIYPTFLTLFAIMGLTSSGQQATGNPPAGGQRAMGPEFGIRGSEFVIRHSSFVIRHLMLAAVGVVLLIPTTTAAWAQARLQSARRSLENGAPVVAADKLGQASQFDPRCGTIWRELAAVPSLEPSEVEAALQSAVRAEPRSPLYRCDLADHLADAGRFDDALAEYRKALSDFPNYTRAMIEVCRVAQERGDGRLLRETLLRLHGLERRPYGLYKAIPERPSLEFLYAHAGLIEAAAERIRLPADLIEHSYRSARAFGEDYLRREEKLKSQVLAAHRRDPALIEASLRVKGFREAKGKQVREILAMIEWRRAQAEAQAGSDLRERARALDAEAVSKLEGHTWRGIFVETLEYRRQAGIA